MGQNTKHKGVGYTLRRLRITKGISQETLANRIGFKQAQISKLETCPKKGVSLPTLIKLSQGLEMRAGDFIEELIKDHGETERPTIANPTLGEETEESAFRLRTNSVRIGSEMRRQSSENIPVGESSSKGHTTIYNY